MKFLKVPRKQAETTRLELIEHGIFAPGYAVFSEGDYIFLPVKAEWKDFGTVERDVGRPQPRHIKLDAVLSEFLNDDEIETLGSSFDIVGDIIIIDIPEELESKEKMVGEALLKVHSNVRTVLKKLGPMEGKFRVRRVGLIAGDDRTETIYKEHGCSMKIDVSKAYFSVRLSNERRRIAELVKPGENILALFAGVGPFPLVISRSHPDTNIVAIELNPDAVKYLEENVQLNNMPNIKVVLGDAREVVSEGYVGFADRILMPLPMSAESFLDTAFEGAKDGATIHFYTMVDINEPFKEAMAKAEAAASANNVELELLSERIVRSYSPTIVQVVLDLKVRKSVESK